MSKHSKTATLGNSALTISSQGLGCMGLSEFYGQAVAIDAGTRLIHHALELGITFFDTADMYGSGHNEQLLGTALQGKRQRALLATKFGICREGNQYAREINGRPEYVRKACHESLRRLQTDYIDLYYIHRIDARTPIEETIGEMAHLVAEGKVRAIGICEPSAQTIRKAHQIHPLAAVQSEYSLLTRDPEKEILPLTKELGITFVSYSPICRGLLSTTKVNDHDPQDVRGFLPRFQQGAYEHNQQIAQALTRIAEEKQCSLAQLALAWVLHQGQHIVPIPGTTKQKNLEANVAATHIDLSAEELTRIEHIVQEQVVRGERYTAEGMKGVNL